jgi:hypothetical protein
VRCQLCGSVKEVESQDAVSDITRACFGGHIVNSSNHRCREFLVLNLLQARCNVLAFHYKMGSKRAASEEPIVAPEESKKPKTENITRRALGRPPIRALSLSSCPRPRFPRRLSPTLLLPSRMDSSGIWEHAGHEYLSLGDVESACSKKDVAFRCDAYDVWDDSEADHFGEWRLEHGYWEDVWNDEKNYCFTYGHREEEDISE